MGMDFFDASRVTPGVTEQTAALHAKGVVTETDVTGTLGNVSDVGQGSMGATATHPVHHLVPAVR